MDFYWIRIIGLKEIKKFIIVIKIKIKNQTMKNNKNIKQLLQTIMFLFYFISLLINKAKKQIPFLF